MRPIDVRELADAATNDPEFRREMRYFTGTLKLTVGDEEYLFDFDDGTLNNAHTGKKKDDSCEIFVKGSKDHWENILARYPKPFYHSLQTSVVKHGLKMSTTNYTFAYLPALNRLTDIMRDLNNREK